MGSAGQGGSVCQAKLRERVEGRSTFKENVSVVLAWWPTFSSTRVDPRGLRPLRVARFRGGAKAALVSMRGRANATITEGG